MATAKDIVRRWCEAFNAQDADALAELYHPDAVNYQVAFEPVGGRDAIRDMLHEGFVGFPDMGFEVENLFEDGEWAILEWRGWSTHLGDFQGHPPTGRRAEIRGCGFFHVRDGQIIFQRGYFDRASWFGQLGLPLG